MCANRCMNSSVVGLITIIKHQLTFGFFVAWLHVQRIISLMCNIPYKAIRQNLGSGFYSKKLACRGPAPYLRLYCKTMNHCQMLSVSPIWSSVWKAHIQKLFPWQCNCMLLEWLTGRSLRGFPRSCPENKNVLNAVRKKKAISFFHNHSWDFLHFPNAGVTLSLIAAE